MTAGLKHVTAFLQMIKETGGRGSNPKVEDAFENRTVRIMLEKKANREYSA
ncbi:hypothetical protein J7L29_06740 [Candidatus Bathyarchaeota archaeon]|nr:hypothetical protein [Candidatus Bathyarchaeota archaeon]